MSSSRKSVGLLADIGQCLLKTLTLNPSIVSNKLELFRCCSQSSSLQFHCQRVQCFRVGNAEIPNDKRLGIALQHIRGIGRQRSHQILVDLSLEDKLTKDLTALEFHNLRDEVSKYLIGEELTRVVRSDIQKMADIQCYRGYNHASLLPCRGQRTKTNARTRKGIRTLKASNWDQHQSLAERMQKFQERSSC